MSLEQLAIVVDQLEPLQSHWEHSQGSVLLRELANCKNIDAAFSNASETPLLHAMSAVHGYVVMLVHVCRTGQSEIRNLLIERWGQNNKYGQKLLYKLVQLYTALVWESTLLLALCTDDIIPVGCDFGKEDLEKLPKEKLNDQSGSGVDDNTAASTSNANLTTSNTTTATSMNDLLHENIMDIDRVLNLIDTTAPASGDIGSTDIGASVSTTSVHPTKDSANKSRSTTSVPIASSPPSASGKQSSQRRIIATPSQLRYIKSLLGASSRLGRALAELFGLLVKLCVGSRIRMRHPQNVTTNYMSSASRDIARVLSYILVDGLSHDQLPPSPIPKLKQTFLICSIGFTSPMLFDEKRYAYHLMLHKFCEEGGLQAFFEMFDFALNSEQNAAFTDEEKLSSKEIEEESGKAKSTEANLSDKIDETTSINARKITSLKIPKESSLKSEEHGEFPAGSGEFLDAWLMLLEKMVNPKAILEAPHVIVLKSLRNKPEFDTMSYLINAHRLAFQTVTKIWSFKPIRTYGPRMTESMLTIVKHIYKGEPILREKYNKKLSEQQSSTDKPQNPAKFGTVFQRTPSQFDSDSNRLGATNRSSSSTLAPSNIAFNTATIASATTTGSVTNNTSGTTVSGTTGSTSSIGPSGTTNTTLNEAHLNQLMDMGFLQEHCREALFYTTSVEQATEYLLVHAFAGSSENAATTSAPTAITTTSGGNNLTSTSRTITSASAAIPNTNQTLATHPTNTGMDSDDDDNIDAEMIVLMGPKLLTESKLMSVDGETRPEQTKRNRRGMRSTQITLPNDPPLSEQLLSSFSEEAVRTSLYLMDQVPDAVFKGTELLAILFKREEIKWKMLATIIGTMIDCAEQLHTMLCDRITPIETIFFGEIGCRFAVRLHIFCLFLEGQYPDLRTPTILSIKEFKLMPKLISLLNETEAVLTSKAGKCQYTPKWLSQMILLVDLYEKVVILTRRRNEMHRITTQIWKWYDVASGKWNAYSVSNNKIINDAYWAGEPSVRVSVGRHRYTINFNCMSQVNEETGNHRPVVLGLLSSFKRMPERVSATLSYIFGSDNEDGGGNVNAENEKQQLTAPITSATTATPSTKKSNTNPLPTIPVVVPSTLGENELDKTTAAAVRQMRERHLLNYFKTMYTESVMNNTISRTENPPITADDVKLLGLEEFSTEDIVATCVRLMSPNIQMDRDSLHALMKLCVRLTTKYENAEVFAREGGIKLLLEMKQTCGYIGFSTLANLLIRHTLEEPKTLAMAMEKVIAARTLQTIPPGYRDLIFMLRRMSSAVARDPDIFKQVARSMLRIDVNALRRGVFSEDYRLIMKSISPPSQKRPVEKLNESSMPVKVIYDLLQALIVPISVSQPQTFEEKVTTNANKNQNQPRTAGSSISSTFNTTTTTTTITTGSNSTNNINDVIEETLFRHHRPLVDDNDIVSCSSFSSMGIGSPNNDNQRTNIDIGLHRTCTTTNRELSSGSSVLDPSSTPSTSSSAKQQQQQSSNDVWNMSCSKTENDKPLLPKSTILKALAEAVRSYQSVGVIIADYTYQPQPNTLIRKVQPALAFILDNLLPSTEQNPDRECSSGARMLIAALSAATDSQITQYTVVTEVRAAILRALSWPEIPEKHQQLQLLTALIPTMIENCPPDNPALMRLHQHQTRRNDIFNIMVRKGLIADLANITQSLDLSSPHTVLTIGTALKSLEQLLRMSNQPITPISLQLNKNRNTESENTDAINASDAQIIQRQIRSLGGTSQRNTADEPNDNNPSEVNVDENMDDDPQSNEIPTENLPMNTAEENNEIVQIDETIDANNIMEPESAVAPEELNDINEQTVNLVAQVQAIGSTMEELMEHFMDRDPLIDEHGPQPTRASINSGTATRNSVTASVVNAGSAGNTSGNLQPIELAEERYILEEDDTSSDSESNGSEENDEERDEEMDDDENEDEAEDRSDLEVDEETRQFIEMYDHVYGRHLSPSIPELERDSEDILMIQYADNGRDVSANSGNGNSVGVSVNVGNNITDDDNDQPGGSGNNVPSGSGINRVSVTGSNNSNSGENNSSGRFLLHANFPSIFESISGNVDASNESATPGSPSASNVRIGGLHISTSNPRSGVVGGGSSSNQPPALSQLIQFRSQRNSNRQRRCAYLNLNSRNSNPPAILQRLLGPTTVASNIGLGQVIANANGSASFRDATRVVVMDNGFGIFANAGEPSIDLVDQAGYLFGRSLAATLNSTPSPLHWWLEEAKVLGLESQADVCLTVCNDLIPDLETQRSLELSKTKSKRKKKSPSDTSSSSTNTTQKQKNNSTNNQTPTNVSSATAVTRTNATISPDDSREFHAVDEGANESNRTQDSIEINIEHAANNDNENDNNRDEPDENYDSEEVEETDDSEQADEDYEEEDNSSKNEDDLEIEEVNNTNQNINSTNRNADNRGTFSQKYCFFFIKSFSEE